MATKELSVKDKLAKLRAEAAKLEATRAGELKNEIRELIKELNELTGSSFTLSEGHASAVKKGNPQAKAKTVRHKNTGVRIAAAGDADPNGDWAT